MDIILFLVMIVFVVDIQVWVEQRRISMIFHLASDVDVPIVQLHTRHTRTGRILSKVSGILSIGVSCVFFLDRRIRRGRSGRCIVRIRVGIRVARVRSTRRSFEWVRSRVCSRSVCLNGRGRVCRVLLLLIWPRCGRRRVRIRRLTRRIRVGRMALRIRIRCLGRRRRIRVRCLVIRIRCNGWWRAGVIECAIMVQVGWRRGTQWMPITLFL